MLKYDRSRALRQEALYGFAQGRLSIERLQAKLWRIDNKGSRAAWQFSPRGLRAVVSSDASRGTAEKLREVDWR